MGSFKVEAIILRSREFQEADRVVTLLSERRGKLEAVARGARRARSRLLGVTQPFSHIRASLYSGKSMDTLSQGEIIEGFQGLREDLVLMAHAAYMCEMVDESIGFNDSTPGIYALLLRAFRLLRKGVLPATVRSMFQIKSLAALGMGPGLERCLACEGEVENPYFSPAQGGILCKSCGEGAGASVLSRKALEYMRALLRLEPEASGRLRLDAATQAGVSRILDDYILWHFGRPLKSLDFLKSLAGQGE